MPSALLHEPQAMDGQNHPAQLPAEFGGQHFTVLASIRFQLRHRVLSTRSFAAATSFIALVIFCVFLTDEIRLLMSLRLGMPHSTFPSDPATYDANPLVNSSMPFLRPATMSSVNLPFSRSA